MNMHIIFDKYHFNLMYTADSECLDIRSHGDVVQMAPGTVCMLCINCGLTHEFSSEFSV